MGQNNWVKVIHDFFRKNRNFSCKKIVIAICYHEIMPESVYFKPFSVQNSVKCSNRKHSEKECFWVKITSYNVTWEKSIFWSEHKNWSNLQKYLKFKDIFFRLHSENLKDFLISQFHPHLRNFFCQYSFPRKIQTLILLTRV